MYHIRRDRRAERSAQALYEGLIGCLETTALSSVSVSDVSRAAGSSRATFYRLFDNVPDILDWKCEQILCQAIARIDPAERTSFQAAFTQFISSWIEEPRLVAVLATGPGLDILDRAHTRHMDEIVSLFYGDAPLAEPQRDQLSWMLAGIMPVAFRLWLRYPDDRPEAVLARVKGSARMLRDILEH